MSDSLDQLSTIQAPTVLVNVSNHPSDKWPDAQKNAAAQWADQLVDRPFPHVSPLLDAAELVALAEHIADELQERYARIAAVHLMGELTLTYALVGILHKRGFTVLASTTERIVHAEEDGRKTSEFRFVRFREYPRAR